MSIHVVFSLISAVMQMAATILVLSCVVNFFSLKPGGSLKVVYFSLFYFFGSSIFLFIGASWLSEFSIPVNFYVGISAFVEAFLVHIVYGSLIAVFYSGTLLSKAASLSSWIHNKRTNRSRGVRKKPT